MAEDRVDSAGSLSHDNESDREGCRTKEPPDPQATPRRTSRRNLYMRRWRHRDASRHKLALRTLSSLHHSSEEDSQGVRSIINKLIIFVMILTHSHVDWSVLRIIYGLDSMYFLFFFGQMLSVWRLSMLVYVNVITLSC